MCIIKYAIRQTGSSNLSRAGIYRLKSGRPVFFVLTCESAENNAFMRNRMLVILTSDVIIDWPDVQYSAVAYHNNNGFYQEIDVSPSQISDRG